MLLNGESAPTCLPLSGREFWFAPFFPSTSLSFLAPFTETCLSSILGSNECTPVRTRASLPHGTDTSSTRNFSEGAETLDSPEISSPLLPSTLDPLSGFVTQKFSSSSTSPSVIFSFDRYTVYQLLLSLAVSLRRGCCKHRSHSTNLGSDNFSAQILEPLCISAKS